MSGLKSEQREKTLEMTEAAEEILARARRGAASQAEIAEASRTLLARLAEEHATGDALEAVVAQRDIAVKKPLQIKPR